MRRLCIILVFFASCTTQKNSDRKIIDTHFHAFSFDEYGYPSPPNEITGVIPGAKTNAEVTKNMIDELNRFNINIAIASGPVKMIEAYQAIDNKRFLGGYYFSPRSPLPDTTEFVGLIRDGTIKVLGELGLQYAGLTLTDTLLIPYLNICSRYGVPIALIPAWEIQVLLTRNVVQIFEHI